MLRLVWYRKKYILISLAVLTIGFLGFFLFNLMKDTNIARAGNPAHIPVYGWAWTDTFGWISMHCYSDSVINPTQNPGCTDYGVTVDPVSGDFSANSYAWSDNVGWIDFNPVGPFPGATTSPAFCDLVNGKCVGIKGWAKVVVLGDDGWIKFDSEGASPIYATTIDNGSSDVNNWGDFKGWAWNGEVTNKKGLGWISFNCSDTASCATSDYKVTGRPSDIVIQNIVQTPGKESNSLTIAWNSNIFGRYWFEVWRQRWDTSNANWGALTNPSGQMKNNLNAITYEDNTLGPNPYYKRFRYQVKVCNLFGCDISPFVASRPSAFYFNDGTDVKLSGICFDKDIVNTSYVDLEWSQINESSEAAWTGSFNKYEIKYCVLEEGQTTCLESDWKNINPSLSLCNLSTKSKTTCRDVLNSTRYNDRYNRLRYRVRAVGTGGLCIDGPNSGEYCTSDASCTVGLNAGTCQMPNYGTWIESKRDVRPCPRKTQPKYKEVRPE